MNVRRWIRRGVRVAAVIALIVVIAVVALMTFDLGPTLRERAEREGSKRIERPIHIGRLGIRLGTGQFIVEDVMIEGVKPTDHPFFTAKRIAVDLPWWTFFGSREVLIRSLELTDWDMQVEMRDGQDTFIKLPKSKPGEKRSFTVTLQNVHASRGRFTYIDHGTWSTTSPNLDVRVTHETGEYRGRASFSDGRVQIRDSLPFRSDMRCSFRLDGGKVHLNWIDLKSDGAQTVVAGDVDFGNWPEMFYRVRSHVNFARMRQIFFANEKFRVGGEGEFTGTFRLYRGGGRDLKGSFTSDLLTVNQFRFPDLAGDLRWLPHEFAVTNASARFHQGTAHFTYSIAPIGMPTPAVAKVDAAYQNVDLAGLTDFLKTKGLRLSGRASGRNILEWPLGKFSDHRGEGEITVRAPSGAVLYSRTGGSLSPPLPPVPPLAQSAANDHTTTKAPISYTGPVPNLGYLPIAGTLRYRYGPEWVDVLPSSMSTPATYVEFSGRTAYGDSSSIDFYARSGDWQKSDDLLAAAITAFGSPTHTVVVGGDGEFTGRLLNSFRRPRIEGSFSGRQVKAFDVVWGAVRGRVVVDNGYVDVTDGVVTKDEGSEISVEVGRFSLSTPRDDGGEEINTRVRVLNWPISDLRHVFDLDAYPIDGKAGGDYHVYGKYRRPLGYGQLTITDGVAYGETFERGAGSMRLEGIGVRIDSIELTKGGGTITGAAYVSWDGRYSFNADTGRRIQVEQLNMLKVPQALLSGLAGFKASGSGAFASPRYRVDFTVADLYVGDEGVGFVKGTLNVRDQMMGVEVSVASRRLAISGQGQISMTPGADANLFFSVTDTSLDPYLRAIQPGLSPFTRAVASGTVRVVGPLAQTDRLLLEVNVENLRMVLFDYQIINDPKYGPLRMTFENNVIRLGAMDEAGVRTPMRFVGPDATSPDTRLSVAGDINVRNEQIGVHAEGDANLGILQAFFRDIRSSGRARLAADMNGPLRKPVFTGSATITDGRIRYYSLPHSIDAINGPITFAANAIRFGDPARPADELKAQVGGGPVTFGGRIDMNGFTPSAWALTATGGNMHLRYPEGFNSVVDAYLALVGPYASPTLSGTVTVTSAVFSKTLDITPSLLELAGAGGGGSATRAAVTPAPGAPSFPLRFNVQIKAARTLRVQTNVAQIVASADLTLGGNYEHPTLLGRANVDRGHVNFEGKRLLVTQGEIQFNNPSRIEPFFEFEAETRVRAPGQSYVLDLHVVGTMKRLTTVQVTSYPPLPEVDAWSLLFGDVRSASDVQNAELRALRRPNATQQQILQSRVEQMLLSPLYANVGRAVERTFGLDTFQITPSLFDEYQRLSPTARLTIGKQISSRVYLTISRSVYSPQEDIVYLLQFDQSDRVSWVLSRNEDKTYALDVRVRHRF